MQLLDYLDFNISFSSNTLTIFWSAIDKDDHLKYLKVLLELWPGLILRLQNFKNVSEKTLELIQRLLIYCDGSHLCWKLSFSKVVINIDIDKLDTEFMGISFFVLLDKLKHLFDSLSKIYDVELENITYENLFKDRGSQFKGFIKRQRDEYNNEKLKFERALKYSRIKCYLDDFFNGTDEGFNQTIEELKLKEFEFYADRIGIDRYDLTVWFSFIIKLLQFNDWLIILF